MYNTGTGTITLRNCLFNENYGEYGGAVANPPATMTAESVAARVVTRIGVEVIVDLVRSRTVSSALGKASDACMTLLALA